MRIIVINLDKDTDRRARVEKRLAEPVPPTHRDARSHLAR